VVGYDTPMDVPGQQLTNMEQVKANKKKNNNRKHQNTNKQQASTESENLRLINEAVDKLSLLILENPTEVMNNSHLQTKLKNLGLFDQHNYASALNIINQKLNGNRQMRVCFSECETDLGSAHYCTIEFEFPTVQNGEVSVEKFGAGGKRKDKRSVREAVSKDILVQVISKYMPELKLLKIPQWVQQRLTHLHQTEKDWLEDKTTDGRTEKNPGPTRYIGSRQYQGPLQVGGVTITPEVPSAGQHAVLEVRYPFDNPATVFLDGQVIGQPQSFENTFSRRLYTPFRQQIKLDNRAWSVSYRSNTPGPSNDFITLVWTIYQDDPQVTIIEQPVSITGEVDANIVSSTEIDTNITNASVPIALPTGGSLEVTIDTETQPLRTVISEDSLPLWTSDIGGRRRTTSEASEHNGSLEADAASHNSIMHMTNGNPLAASILPDLALNIHQTGAVSSPRLLTRAIDEMKEENEVRVFRPSTIQAKAGVVNLSSTLCDNSAFEKSLSEVLGNCEPVEKKKFDIEAHFTKMSNMNGNIGISFRLCSIVYNIPIKNQFASLDKDMETLESLHKTDEEQQVNTYTKPKMTQTTQKIKAKPRPLPETPVKQLTPEDKLKQYEAVLARVVSKLQANPESTAIWFRSMPKTKFAQSVANALFGLEWEKRAFDPLILIAYCSINNIPEPVLKLKIPQFDLQYEHYRDQLDCENLRVDLELAKLHNKAMHAYNGNPFTQSMTEIDNLPTWEQLQDSEFQDFPRLSGIELQALITNVHGDSNPNQTNLFYQDRARGNIVTPDNVVLRNAVMHLPSTNMIPREYWLPGGIQPDPYGNSVTEINVSEYYNYPLQPTMLSQNLSNAVKNANTTVWRRDNTLLSGFNVFDVAGQNTTMLQKGLSMERFCFVLDMLHSIMSYETDYGQTIPASTWSLINPSFIPDISPPTLGINDSPNPTERCGGNNPVFPWGVEKGKVAFHVTAETVPTDRKANAIYLPPALLQSEADGYMAIPLFIMGFAEWPWSIFTFKKNGKFSVEGSETVHNTTFIPTQTWCHVPGQRTLDIILPRGYSEANPTSQAQANQQAVIRPLTGDMATTGLAENIMLDINYMGPTTTEYPLTDFLYTWWNQYDATSIKNFIGRLGVMIGIKDTMYSVHEKNIVLNQHFPAMYLDKNDGPWKRIFPAGGIDENYLSRMHKRYYCNHTAVTNLPTGFPYTGPVTSNYRIVETNPTVWNKVALGLATAENISSEGLHELPAFLGDPRNPLWERLGAIPPAICWGVFYIVTGLSVEAWNAAYTSVRNSWIQKRARLSFATTQSNGSLVPAEHGGLVRVFMESMFKRSPSLFQSLIGSEDTNGNPTGETVPVDVSHFECWLPSNSYASVYIFDKPDSFPHQAPSEIYSFIPTIIPDFWYSFMTRSQPRFSGAFPPPFGFDSTCGYRDNTKSQEMELFQIPNVEGDDVLNGNVGPWITRPAPVFKLGMGPEGDDHELWNTRMWFIQPTYRAGNLAGLPVKEKFPTIEGELAPQYKPVPRAAFLFDGERYPWFSTPLTTMCFPSMSITGQKIIPFLTASESVIPSQAIIRVNRLVNGAWLLNNVYAEFQLQNITKHHEDLFDKFNKKRRNSSSFLASSPGGAGVATPAVVAQQAVIPEDLPSISGNTQTTAQPSEPVGLNPSLPSVN